ncbi:MAG: HAD family phosphatase [Verrucomicrobiota bacterium]
MRGEDAGAMRFEVVLFDFDGTLVDTEGMIYSVWADFYRSEGAELALEEYVQCIGADFDAWSPKTHLEELTGRQYDWEALDPVREEAFRERLEDAGPMLGAREILESLAESGVPMGVVSASSHGWVDGWLEKLGMAKYFAHTVCRGDAPRSKPAPDLYLRAAELMGVEAGWCLVVEDSLNGTQAAKKAGMTVVAVPNRVTAVSDFSLADAVFSNLEKVLVALPEIEPCQVTAG